MCACAGLAALSVPNSDAIILTEQLQVLPLTGYVRLGDVDANGWVPVEYVGTENVTLSATVNGTNVSIVLECNCERYQCIDSQPQNQIAKLWNSRCGHNSESDRLCDIDRDI